LIIDYTRLRGHKLTIDYCEGEGQCYAILRHSEIHILSGELWPQLDSVFIMEKMAKLITRFLMAEIIT